MIHRLLKGVPMKRSGENRIAILIFLVLLGTALSAEPDVYFRSNGGVPAGDRVPLPGDLSDGQTLVWKADLPAGHSTPCVTADRIFVSVFEKKLATVALDRKTGTRLWKRVVKIEGIEPTHSMGSPASSSPASDGERVYVFFGSYGLVCYDLEGKLIWDKRMGPFQDDFGASSSPVLAGDKVILNEDHDTGSFLIALDKLSGKTVWETPRSGHTRSYSTPVVWKSEGRETLLVAGALQLTAYDAQKGKRLWWINGLARIVNPTPVLGEDQLFVASWSPGGDTNSRISMEGWSTANRRWDTDGNQILAGEELPEGEVKGRLSIIDLDLDGGVNQVEWERYARVFKLARNSILAIRPGGQGDLTGTNVLWSYLRGVPYVTSPVLYRQVVYMVKNGGIVTSLDAESGKLLKQGRLTGLGNYFASPVAGDGKVYLASESGVITVLKAGVEWEISSSHDLDERIMASPVIADGRIYVRTEEALYSYGDPKVQITALTESQ